MVRIYPWWPGVLDNLRHDAIFKDEKSLYIFESMLSEIMLQLVKKYDIMFLEREGARYLMVDSKNGRFHVR